jgi:mono/diheme cytochrome c family protein
MRRLLKALQYLAAGAAGLILLAAAAVYGFSEARYRKEFVVTPEAVAIPADSVSIARGGHIVQSFGGCVGCHGENLAGKMVIDEPVLGRIYGANLTRGKGGVGAALTDADFVRAIRHGIGPSGRALKVMPSTDYVHFSDEDLADVVAYVRSRPAVDNATPSIRVGPVGRALFVAGKLPILSAEEIDHANPGPAAVTAAPTADYGRYLASIGCEGCHGPSLSGGPIASGAPDWPPAANLTPAGRLKGWSEADFSRVLRTGVRPDGAPVNAVMPWQSTSRLSDDEIHALWLYLRSLPAAPTGALAVTAAR